MSLREDADKIVSDAIRSSLPDAAVAKALKGRSFGAGRLVMVAVGKAAWQMASAACAILGSRLEGGVVITKYGHSKGDIAGIRIFEAGHPVPDASSFAATDEAIKAASGLSEKDTVLFLLSGGGSAFFEKPLVPQAELEDVTKQLLACGASIVEINTIRKRISAVKGGKFARLCAPARVYSIVLSDIIGDPLDMIASGPAYPDSSTCGEAIAIAKRYGIKLSEEAQRLLRKETPKALGNVETKITGSVRQLCGAASKTCSKLGYAPILLTDEFCCTARDAGSFLGAIAKTHKDEESPLAFIADGETVVHLSGKGLGGRNQKIALAAAPLIEGLNAAVFSFGSDGTDGPTDAAGGYRDGDTMAILREKGINVASALAENDSYNALQACGGLIVTGPTGTNVNGLSVALTRRQGE